MDLLSALSLTPGDTAGVRGHAVLQAYLDALIASGYEIRVADTGEEEDTLDISWPALE